MREICSKLTIKHQNDVVGVVLVFLLLTLNILNTFFSVSIVKLEQVNVSWVRGCFKQLKPVFSLHKQVKRFTMQIN